MSNRVSLTTIRRGAAIEMVDDAIQQALENVIDPNTEATAKRTVTLKLTFSPDKERETIGIDLAVKVGVAPQASVQSMAWVQHTTDGVIAVENDPRQPSLYGEDGETAEVVGIEKGAKR